MFTNFVVIFCRKAMAEDKQYQAIVTIGDDQSAGM